MKTSVMVVFVTAFLFSVCENVQAAYIRYYVNYVNLTTMTAMDKTVVGNAQFNPNTGQITWNEGYSYWGFKTRFTVTNTCNSDVQTVEKDIGNSFVFLAPVTYTGTVVCCPEGQHDNGSGVCVPDCNPGEIKINGVCIVCPSGHIANTDPDYVDHCAPFCWHGSQMNVPGYQYPGDDQCVEPPCGPGEVADPVTGICKPNCTYPAILNPVDGSCYVPDCPEDQERINDECVPKCNPGYERCNGECVMQCGGEGFYRNWETCACEQCPPGQVYLEGVCQPDPFKCPEGYQRQIPGDNTSPCVLIPLECPEGQEQQGTRCVPKPTGMPSPEATPAPDSNDPPPAPTDPNPDPASPDPTPPANPDPAKAPAEKTDERMSSVDQNIAKLLNGQGVQTQVLRNIAENQAKAVNNLAALGGKMDANTKAINAMGADLTAINKNTDGIEQGLINLETGVERLTDEVGDGFDSVVSKLDEMKTNEQGPAQPELPTTIDDEDKYKENEDPQSLADEQVQQDIAHLDQQVTPAMPFTVTTDITSDSCISWDVLGQHCEACFDKPWILNALGLMKVVLIALGYFQAFQLANRALVA